MRQSGNGRIFCGRISKYTLKVLTRMLVNVSKSFRVRVLIAAVVGSAFGFLFFAGDDNIACAQDLPALKTTSLEAKVSKSQLRQRLNRKVPDSAAPAPAFAPPISVKTLPAPFSSSSSSGQENAVIENAFPSRSQNALPPSDNIGAQFPLAASVGAENLQKAAAKLRLEAERYSLKIPLMVSTQEFVRLNPYDIVVIIDNSGSMNERDCPGGLSRWQWCARQTLDASRQLKAALKRPITLALFSEHYKIFPRSDYLALSTAFNVNSPGGGTYLSKPLRAVFDDYFQRKASGSVRKLLVQIITDGEPSDKGACLDLLEATAAKIGSSCEIRVSFIGIGTDREGQEILQEFAQAGKGRAEFINSLSFEEVKSQGLLKALAASLGPN